MYNISIFNILYYYLKFLFYDNVYNTDRFKRIRVQHYLVDNIIKYLYETWKKFLHTKENYEYIFIIFILCFNI